MTEIAAAILKWTQPLVSWLVRRSVAALAVIGITLAPEQETALDVWLVTGISLVLGVLAEWLMRRHTAKAADA